MEFGDQQQTHCQKQDPSFHFGPFFLKEQLKPDYTFKDLRVSNKTQFHHRDTGARLESLFLEPFRYLAVSPCLCGKALRRILGFKDFLDELDILWGEGLSLARQVDLYLVEVPKTRNHAANRWVGQEVLQSH